MHKAPLFLVCLIILLSPIPLQAQSATLEVVKSFLEAWNEQDVERIAALCHERAEYTEVATGSVFHGSEGCARYARETFEGAPNIRFETTGIIVDGNRASAEWIMTGTQTGDWPGLPATGREFEIAGVSILEIDQALIVRVADYWDLYTLLNQLGVLPDPATEDSSD